MPKIAHFLSFGIGGADRAAIELVRALLLKNLDITVLYNEMSFPMRTSDQDEDQPLLSTFSEVEKLTACIQIKSNDEIDRLNFDLVHTHRSGEDEWLLPDFGKNPRRYKIVETNFHGAIKTIADARIYPSKALMDFSGITLGEESRVIPNIVNSINGQSARADLGISNKTTVFGRVGRADKSIYSSTLLKEYARIENENTLLLWVGKSKLAVADAKRYGIKNILWMDPIGDPKEMADIYETMDIYLHVNALGETFGNTVSEAVIRGVPVVSLRGSRRYPQAQSELLRYGQYCENKRQFRTLIKRYLEKDEFREEVSRKNHEFGQENLSPEVISKKVLNLYEELLS